MEDITFTLKKNPLDPVYRYIQKKSTLEKKSEPEIIERLLEAGLALEVEKLYHEKYLRREMSLNGISEALGIPYRKLYQIMEELGLTV
ncbi:hypothetical protein HYR99_17415 [Candidatus Poribacteria bacterium]|nr:hypothetical protein [Candidatus Poribacteria bacterium]